MTCFLQTRTMFQSRIRVGRSGRSGSCERSESCWIFYKIHYQTMKLSQRTSTMFRFVVIVAMAFFCPCFASKSLGQNETSGGKADPNLKPTLQGPALEKANDLRDRYIFLATKFKHTGVEFQSKVGFGCIIATHSGQRILAMPSSMIEPKSFPLGDLELSIPSSMILAVRINDFQFRDRSNSFSKYIEALLASAPRLRTTASPKTSQEQQSEEKIRRALHERGDINFNAQPLSGVMRYFETTYDVPIVIDLIALDRIELTSDQPITLNLPPVSFRSALNIMLGPLELAYVIENEVLKITSKKALENVARVDPDTSDLVESQKGTVGMMIGDGTMGHRGGAADGIMQFSAAGVQRYQTLDAAQSADSRIPGGSSRLGLLDLSDSDASGRTPSAGPFVGQRREYAAIHGPLVAQVDAKLGVAFVSLPGDFPSIQIPTRSDSFGTRYVMHEQNWLPIVTENDKLPTSVVDGSPVVDERGEPIGMYIGKRVVSLQQVFQSFLGMDSMSLGYWGAETKSEQPEAITELPSSTPPEAIDGLPELITAKIRTQIAKAASLQGKEKAIAMQTLRDQLDSQVKLRKTIGEKNLSSIRNKLDQLRLLIDQMNEQDYAEANKILPEERAFNRKDLKNGDPFKGDVNDDPFK